MKPILTTIFVLLLLSSCDRNKTEGKLKDMALKIVTPPSTADKIALNKASMKPQSPNEIAKKIIKEGEIRFETKNLSDTRNAMINSLQKLGGYVAEENQTNDGDNGLKQYNLKIRVPAANFDQFVNGISDRAGKIDSKNIRVRDVSTQYIDIAARLDNKKKLEQQYLELLKKGTKMADLLEIENKITEIRTDIESTQGELNYLQQQVDYSGLDITFYNAQPGQDNGQTFGGRLTTALLDGWNILVTLFFAIVEVWPLWIIGIVAYFLVRAYRKKQPVKKITP